MKHSQTGRKFFIGFIMVATLTMQIGCSVFMAAKQPPKKNLGVLKESSPRSLLIAELGQPITTQTIEGNIVDVFSFTQGYSKSAKAGRAIFHGVADIFTIGVWEVVGTPTEYVFDGKKLTFEVTYDDNERVKKVVILQK